MTDKRVAHNYHLVENSPWPIYVSISLFSMIISVIMLFNNKSFSFEIFLLSIIALSFSLYFWMKEIIIESTYEGKHTEGVQKGLSIGFILLIISEICAFITLFFAYFYNSLIPSVEFSSTFPPIGIETINPKALPLLNTLILFLSGITATLSLNLIISGFRIKALFYLLLTIILGSIFSYFQYMEYVDASYTITDSVFGSNFFTLTGFHGIHVIFGIFFLFIAFLRLYLNHFSSNHFLNVSFANIYWHFVDYVWIILFVFLYCWAS